jgi:hypothetical protein
LLRPQGISIGDAHTEASNSAPVSASVPR